ncbi:DUF3419 family protein [Granulosicoccaceae sp. 1_MG-2023]|nr:DUF3419 family protein [Granulosicoccaceae sp. 1_MG-2023]
MTGASHVLKSAVQQNKLASLRGMQQRLFRIWFNSFIYNQIWEDPRIDMEALQLREDSDVLTIASGGCNVLNYLTASPARITAVDLNPYHLSLTRLKIAAMQQLPDFDAFYDFFGYGDCESNPRLYRRYIRDAIDPELRAFWDGRRFNGRRRISLFRDGLYRHTRFGWYMRFLHFIARCTDYQPQRLLSATSQAEQAEIFRREIRPFFDNTLVRLLGKLPMSVFSLGIPPQQYEAMKREGNLLAQFRERVERLACDFPVSDNYFAWQAFSHSYDHEKRKAVPDYLREENYTTIRDQLHKIDTHNTTLTAHLKSRAANSLDRFVFLDAQDWMSDAALIELWQEIVRTGRPGSRIIFRTAAAESPLESVLPDSLTKQFSYDPAASRAFFRRDRSAIYGGFHLYVLKHG